MGPRRLPGSPAGAALFPEPACPLASRARSHSRLAHGRPPHRPATHTALCAPSSCSRPPRTGPARAARAAPAPSHLVRVRRRGARVSGLRGAAGGAEGRAGGRLAPGPGGWEGWGEQRRLCVPAKPASASGKGRRGRGARGAAAPGGSPTRGSCCLNAGALPSRRLPRPAQPRPPGAPVPCVPGRCSLPGERRDWSARAELPSPTPSAAADSLRRRPDASSARFQPGMCAEAFRGAGQLPESVGALVGPAAASDTFGFLAECCAGPAAGARGRRAGK